jgi:hypothetical protein
VAWAEGQALTVEQAIDLPGEDSTTTIASRG